MIQGLKGLHSLENITEFIGNEDVVALGEFDGGRFFWKFSELSVSRYIFGAFNQHLPCTQNSQGLEVPYFQSFVISSSRKVPSLATCSSTTNGSTFDTCIFVLFREICRGMEYMASSCCFVNLYVTRSITFIRTLYPVVVCEVQTEPLGDEDR
jgi:hypothetical protein